MRSHARTLTALQLVLPTRNQRSQIPIRHAIHRLIHNTIYRSLIAVPKKPTLPRRLEELAPDARPIQRIIAAHVPRQDAQLRQTPCVDAGGIHGDVDGLAVVAVCVAGVGAVEEEGAGGVVCEEGREDVAVVAVWVGEVVEGEGGGVPAAVPPGVADVLLVVACACFGEVVGRVHGGAVEGEGLRVAVEADDAVDVVACQRLRDDVGVEGVEEVVCLVWEGGGGGGEVALAREGEEHGGVLHYVDEGFVEVVLHCLDDGAHLGGESGHLYHLRRYGINGEDPPPDLGDHEERIL